MHTKFEVSSLIRCIYLRGN